MKIAIFTDVFLPKVDGIVTSTVNLSKSLSDRGHKIFIICPRFKGVKEFSYPNIKVIRVASVPAYFYEDFKFTSIYDKKILKFLKDEKIDIIHATNPLTLGIQAVIISKLLKIPIVGTFHTFFADPQYLKVVGLNYKFVEKFMWRIAKVYYNQLDFLSCPTLETKKQLKKNHFKNPIKVISNGIDFAIFDNSRTKEIKNKYNPKGKILLYTGRVSKEKNIDYLLECFVLVKNSLPETILLIVGDGPQYQEIKNKIKSLDLEKNVIMTGMIPHEKLVKSSILSAADLFVTASTTETQGISMLEAQANGNVSIGINERGVKDSIKDGFNGYLLEYGNKVGFADRIIKLLKDETLYKKMRKNTPTQIKEHDIKNIAKIWEKEYLAIIKKCKKSYG